MTLILNRDLRLHHVPDFEVATLDPRGFDGEGDDRWRRLWEFCLTFDGYRYFGGDDGAPGRLDGFATSVKAAFESDGQLPALDLRLLRACLFLEQRRLKWSFAMSPTYPQDHARFLDVLLAAVRRDIST